MAHAPCLGRPPQADAASADAQEAVQTSDKLRKTLNAVVSALMNHHAQALAHAQALPVEAQASLSALFDQELAGLQQQMRDVDHGADLDKAKAAGAAAEEARAAHAGLAAEVAALRVEVLRLLELRNAGQGVLVMATRVVQHAEGLLTLIGSWPPEAREVLAAAERKVGGHVPEIHDSSRS